jgi:hypothetical protein
MLMFAVLSSARSFGEQESVRKMPATIAKHGKSLAALLLLMQSPSMLPRSPAIHHGSGFQIASDRRASSGASMQEGTREMVEKDPMFIDEASLIAAQGFPISETELISKAKEFLYFGQGVEDPSLLADDFVFMGPFVGGAGGLPKSEYLQAVGGFKIKDAFPDLEPRFMHFRADPLDAGRIWFTSQAGGTNLGTFLGNKPTGKRFETPPQACSIKFNEAGKVIKYTIGHVMERSIGNTGGLGGIFGPAYAIGKPLPFPEAKPWKPSKRYRFFQKLGELLQKMQKQKE